MAEEVGLFRASMPSTLRVTYKKRKCSNLLNQWFHAPDHFFQT